MRPRIPVVRVRPGIFYVIRLIENRRGIWLALYRFNSLVRRRFPGFRPRPGLLDRRTGFRLLGFDPGWGLGLRGRFGGGCFGWCFFRHAGRDYPSAFRGFELSVIAVHRKLYLFHHGRADVRNFFQLLRRHAAQLFDGRNSRLDQLLGQFVAQAIVDEHGDRRSRNSQRGHGGFDLLPLLFLALDVDLPPEKLSRQTHVLPLLANGERELRIVNDYFHVFLGRIDDRDTADLGRTQSMRREGHRVVGELDDIDLLAPQLADDGLDPHALHSHAGTHAVHVAVAAVHGDLGAFAGFTRASLDHYRRAVNLRDFLLE